MRHHLVRAALAAAMLGCTATPLAASAAVCGTLSGLPTALSFNLGTYNPLQTTDTSVPQSFSFKCTNASATVTVSISSGNAGGAGQAPDRFMKGPGTGTSQLFYNLFDPSKAIWSANAQHPVSFTTNATANATTTIPVLAIIPAAVANGRNDVAAGSYSDSLTLTVNF